MNDVKPIEAHDVSIDPLAALVDFGFACNFEAGRTEFANSILEERAVVVRDKPFCLAS
ncbi:MAG: hypothetical protein R3C54_05780 [Parvularculaceae bacterium]